MAELVLGLDLGPTSIGWALINEADHQIVGAGVRVFPEGVEREKGREVAKNQARRIARGMRRQIARRARRRRILRRALVEIGLLPEVALHERGSHDRDAWERDAFKEFDPYTLRSMALREPLRPHDVGRVLLHLNQRRGFRSNRKTDRARRTKNSAMLAELSDLAAQLNGKTLGEHLAGMRGGDQARWHQTRLRGRHTRRDMLEAEFDAVWGAQQRHHPALLSDDQRERIRRIVFFQRALRPPSASLIGRCELEPRLPRCRRADRRAQRFRLLQEVNNLRYMDLAGGTGGRGEQSLSEQQRSKLLDFLSRKKERTFDEIRKHIFEQYDGIRFKLERGERTKLKGMPSDAALASKAAIGTAWWKLSGELRDRIVSAVVEDDENRLRFLLTEAGLPSEAAPAILDKVDLEDGYAAYSLAAIRKLLPHMERALPLTSRDPSRPCALREAGYAMPWERAAGGQATLGEPRMIANPIVRQALFEVRKVVNAILRDLVYRPGHQLARIQVELAREAKGTAEQRAKRTCDMRERERLRDDAADRIREHGAQVSRDAIKRYLLWREQDETCIYSGKPISLAQLLGGEVDIDHILPYGRSLDDSMMNKVVCFRDANRAKGNRVPYEWLAHDAPAYEQVLQRARRLPYPKLHRFCRESVDLEDFFARQFVDTSYISTAVVEYLVMLGAEVLCSNGTHTAELRGHWGLDKVLRTDAADIKNREDHRHHAVDAIVIALTDRSRLQKLAGIRCAGGTERTGEVLPEPLKDFRQQVQGAVDKIIVSFRARRDIHGALHKDKPLGATPDEGVYVRRKPVVELSQTEVLAIRDPGIRTLAIERLRQHGIDPQRGGEKIPAEAWKEPLRMSSGIPVLKARVLVNDKSIVPIRGGTAHVQPGSTHHLCLFERTGPNGKPERYARFVSMLEAARRNRTGAALIERTDAEHPDARFLMSLSGNEMVLLTHNGKDDYYRFETAASTSEQMWFRHHTFAGKSSDKRLRLSKRPGTLQATKVTVDPLGCVRRARD